MTPLTQAQWYAKLRSWVPAWVFQEADGIAEAKFQALAKVLATQETQVAAHIAATFILQAEGDFIDLHGNERKTLRREDELDSSYGPRVQNLGFLGDPVDIKAIVDALLVNGECRVVEDYEGGTFCDRGYFCDRGDVLLERPIKDAFSVIVPIQRKDPLAFFDRDFFMDRDAFAGTDTGTEDILAAIVAAVNEVRAGGCLFRLIEIRGA